MATKRIRKNEDEKLTSSNIEKVISLLEGENPITKKDACAILNIKYNTSRLSTIIEQYKAKKALDAIKRAEKRGKPATAEEIKYIISSYLDGATIDSISNSTYRGYTLINKILEDNNVPIRSRSQNYFIPELIPEAAVRDRFNVGEVVYSARYDSTAKIMAEQKGKTEWIYRLWLLSDKWQQFCYQPASELASLEHLRKIGVAV